ncbi:MAG: hypothetical protein QF472_04750, partial [Candidatus Marinimicrobia bacterium]|nr:hypothetical protein [Candidatus Neomarinimicrobiota bacterium]
MFYLCFITLKEDNILNKIIILLSVVLFSQFLFPREMIEPTPPNRDGSCDSGLFMDCEGNCYPSVYLTFLNNGFCDEGTYGIDFSCEAWGFDGAGCDSQWGGELGDVSYNCADSPLGGDCADECNLPNGDNSSCSDCMGIPNGPNT